MIDRNDGETASYGAMLHRHGAVTFGFLTPCTSQNPGAHGEEPDEEDGR
jgi:hypothetical protein